MTAAALSTGERLRPQSSGVGRLGEPLLLLAPAILFLVAFFGYPVARLLWLSVLDSSGALSVTNYTRLVETPVYAGVLWTTLKIAFWTTLLCIVAGYPVAYFISRQDPSRRSGLLIWVLLPFWTSFLVRTFAWIVLLGRNGVVNDLLTRLGVTDEPLSLIYDMAGVMVGMVHALMPLAILTMIPVMEGIDRNLERASATMGARGGSVFWRIYFPLSLPGVTAAALLVFISALGFFITPALLGSPRQTMIGQLIIQQIQELMNWGFGGAISAALIVVTVAIFIIYDRLVGLSTLAGQAAALRVGAMEGKRAFADRAGRGALRLAAIASDAGAAMFERRGKGLRRSGMLRVSVISVLLFLAAPALFLLPVSVSTSAFIEWPPQLSSGQWYQALAGSDQWIAAAVRSFVIAALSAGLALGLGTPVAFAMLRHPLPAKTAILALFLAPLIVPRIVTSIGLFYFFAQVGLVGTVTGLVVGHAVLALPFVVITVMAVLKGQDRRLEQAAATLGAKRAKVLSRITLPLIAKGLVAAYLFAFVTSLDELTIALFVTGGIFNTLPKLMWDDALLKVSPMLAAVSVILLLLVSVIVLAAERLRRS